MMQFRKRTSALLLAAALASVPAISRVAQAEQNRSPKLTRPVAPTQRVHRRRGLQPARLVVPAVVKTKPQPADRSVLPRLVGKKPVSDQPLDGLKL